MRTTCKDNASSDLATRQSTEIEGFCGGIPFAEVLDMRTISIVKSCLAATVVAAFATLLPIAPAHADLSKEGKEVEREMFKYVLYTFYAKSEGHRDADEFKDDVAGCYATVERGVKLGIEPDETMDGARNEQYLFKSAKAQCAEYEKWQHTIRAISKVKATVSLFSAAAGLNDGFMHGDNAVQLAKPGVDCLAEVNAHIAAGADGNVTTNFDGNGDMTLIAGRDKFCQGLADWGAKYAVSTEAKIKGDKAAVEAKYTKVGISGDKLRIAIANDTGIWGPGCKLLEDPKRIAKAGVLYEIHNTPEGRTGVRRYQFKGNKLSNETYREFDRVENSYKFCK